MNKVTELILNFKPENIWEIGVGPTFLSRAVPFCSFGFPIKLFEPSLQNFKNLIEYTKQYKNIDVYNIALSDEDGIIELNEAGECSWVEGVNSPTAFFGDSCIRKKIKVPACKLSRFDYGQIDIALIDTEGSEWKILSQMVSRPRLISLEMRMENKELNKEYNTPNPEKIGQWIMENHYVPIMVDGADILFRRGDVNI